MSRLLFSLIAAAAVAGCTVSTGPNPAESSRVAPSTTRTGGSSQVRSFKGIANRVEPVAESLCRQRGNVRNCDFKIIEDKNPNAPANAYQTLDKSGRPLLIVTDSLLDDLRNADEVAFVLGHEASHHIEGHIPRTQGTAATGAILAGILVAAGGGNAAAVESAQNIGASVGSRVYSKNFELEADALGTVITKRAGYDPVRGVAYFSRSPDPGDQFLGSHPPNRDRIRIVQQTAAGLN